MMSIIIDIILADSFSKVHRKPFASSEWLGIVVEENHSPRMFELQTSERIQQERESVSNVRCCRTFSGQRMALARFIRINFISISQSLHSKLANHNPLITLNIEFAELSDWPEFIHHLLSSTGRSSIGRPSKGKGISWLWNRTSKCKVRLFRMDFTVEVWSGNSCSLELRLNSAACVQVYKLQSDPVKKIFSKQK